MAVYLDLSNRLRMAFAGHPEARRMTISFPNPFKRKPSPDVPTYDHQAQVKQFTESSASDHIAFYGQVSSNVKQPAAKEKRMSFLSAIGHDFEKVFSFLGSQKAQNIIATGEAVATAVDPALSGVFTIANNWFNEILKLQALGSAAGDTPGSDSVKAAAVLNTLTPQVLSWAAANKATVPNAAKIQAMNDALVEFLDAFGAPGSASATVPTTVTPTA